MKSNNFNISKEDLYQKYINENLSQKDIAKIYGCSRANIQYFLNYFEITRDKKNSLISKEWLTEQYITLNKNQEQIAELAGCTRKNISYFIKKYEIEKERKLIVANMQQNNLLKFGTDHQFKNLEIKDKIKKTNLEKYGVEIPTQSSIIKEKIKNTNIERYGSTSPLQNAEIKEKSKVTNFNKYGNINFIASDNFRNIQIKNGNFILYFGKTINQWSRKYNVPAKNIQQWIGCNLNNLTLPLLINYLENYVKNCSDIENLIKEQLEIEIYDKLIHSKYKPDFKLSDKIYLNVDGLYWHSELFKNSKYHFDLRNFFANNNLRIIQFRANEIYNKFSIVKSIINNALGKTAIKIGARKTSISKISSKDAETFLIQNHMKGYKASKHLGLYFNNELVSVMSYKLGKNKDKSFIKIERFCSKINTNVMGAFNKLLKQIMLELPNLPIHYWVDLRYGTGNFLLNHGFRLEKETLGWEWTDYKETYNRLKCRANMDDRGLSEKEHAAELKWVKIYDAGQRLYILEPTSINKLKNQIEGL